MYFVKDNGSFEKVQVPTTYYYTVGRLIDSDIMTLPNFNFCMHFGTCHKTSQGSWISWLLYLHGFLKKKIGETENKNGLNL